MGYFAVLVDATYSDILHGAAGIMATPELTAAACVSVKLVSAQQLLLICLWVRIKMSYYSIEQG